MPGRSLDQARRAGVVHAVTFNYRGNPLVQQARRRIARGEHRTAALPARVLSAGLAARGDRLLLAARTRAGRRFGRRRGHRFALVRSGRARQRPAHRAGARRSLDGRSTSTKAGIVARGVRRGRRDATGRSGGRRGRGPRRPFSCVSTTARPAASRSVRSAPDTRTTSCSRSAAATGSIRWRQEDQNELWIGHRDRANEILQKDPSLAGSDVRHYARLPGGHQEGWADAFANVIRDIYEFIASGKGPADDRPPTFATFDDGYRAARIVEAILASARTGAWTPV